MGLGLACGQLALQALQEAGERGRGRRGAQGTEEVAERTLQRGHRAVTGT